MRAAKPVFMEVRPFQVSHLCFEVGGILGESFVELGDDVSAFDFGRLYNSFRNAIAPDGNGRLQFDSAAIDLETKVQRDVHADPPIFDDGPALAALRAEPVAAALNKAINVRHNVFLTKNKNAATVVDNMRAASTFKSSKLAQLSETSQRQTDMLANEYQSDHRDGVVKTTVNRTDSISHTTARSVTKGPEKGENKTITGITEIEATTKNVPASNGHETTTINQIEYRAPRLECLARNDRAQISLRDEQLANLIYHLNLERLEEVFTNELASLDTDVNQLQIAYLNTILMSPISGTVTGVYKHPGDPVRPGETVFRVEDNSDVLIVANIVYGGPISIGSTLQIKTTLFDSPRSVDPPRSRVEIAAQVVAARRQGDGDQWEVIAKVSNLDADGDKIFPFVYYFDSDNTEVSILTELDR